MDKQDAKLILIRSILNLEEHKGKGNLTGADLEAEVINNACLLILKNQRAKVGQSKSIEGIILSALKATEDILPIARAFTAAAADLYPDRYKEVSIINAINGIHQNVAWDGMWGFLKDYYQKNHGIEIDNDSR